MVMNFFIKMKGFVILRSDGFKEYSIKYGFGEKLYELFFKNIIKRLKLIVVVESLSNINGFKYFNISIRNYSDLEKNLKTKFIKTKITLSRKNKERKGVFSLIELVNDLDIDYNLNIMV